MRRMAKTAWGWALIATLTVLTGLVACDVTEVLDLFGSIDAAVSTSGVDPDPDGYVLSVEGFNDSLPVRIGADASTRLDFVPVGVYTVTLGDVATNCSVAGGATRSVEVLADEAAVVELAVSCEALPAP